MDRAVNTVEIEFVKYLSRWARLPKVTKSRVVGLIDENVAGTDIVVYKTQGLEPRCPCRELCYPLNFSRLGGFRVSQPP